MNFRFKQFEILQEQCAFKVGTDSVLLGSWANPDQAKTILDIGTGSGVLALMMAQKSDAIITGIDIEPSAYEQAKINFNNSNWKNRLQIQLSSIQDYANNCTHQYDLIITNPPYFTNKAHATGSSISTARNNSKLQFIDLCRSAKKLLNEDGKFYVVLPTFEAKQFKLLAEKEGFVLSKLLKVQTKLGEEFEKRHLMCFQHNAYLFTEQVLVIEESEHLQFTSAYKELTKDFYLAF